MTTTVGISTHGKTLDEYDVLAAVVQSRAKDTLTKERRVFSTRGTESAFGVFLAALPEEIRQVHNCQSCRTFFARYAGLVTIDATGRTSPLLWDAAEVPALYAPAVEAVAHLVRSAHVEGVFLSEDKVWGVPTTTSRKGVTWSHLNVTPPKEVVFARDAYVVMAFRTQEYEMLHRGLAEFPAPLCVQAHTLLTNGQLPRSEKFEGVAKWLVELHAARDAAKGTDAKNNVVWRAVASAPAGFCHVRSGMIGTLLEDLASKIPFEALRRRFTEKMDPLQYQRATAPLSDGNRERAEKVIEDLGLARSLERRFAKLEEVLPYAVWVPASVTTPAKEGGVFGHLRTGTKPPASAFVGAPVTMTWDKFQRTVLPDAARIDYHVPYATRPYFGLVAAQHDDAPPLLQWDSPEKRNAYSWYFYVGGSAGPQWNLAFGALVTVKAITLKPSSWNGGFSHQGDGAFFVLGGAYDTRHERGGGFFTETLRNELHEIRATLEAYMLAAPIAGAKEATACGVALQAGVLNSDLLFRVTGKNGLATDYKIDRWD